MSRILIVSISLLATAACSGSPGALAACDPRALDRPICHLSNPEDLGFLPDRSWVIVSEMGPSQRAAEEDGAPPEPGHLTAIRLLDLELRQLYPHSTGEGGKASTMPGWGDGSCPGPPDPALFKPHGIDVGEGPNGRPALAVVNHGSREAVELFEIGAGRFPSGRRPIDQCRPDVHGDAVCVGREVQRGGCWPLIHPRCDTPLSCLVEQPRCPAVPGLFRVSATIVAWLFPQSQTSPASKLSTSKR